MALFVASLLDVTAWTVVILIGVIFVIAGYEARKHVIKELNVVLFLLLMSCFLLCYGVPAMFKEAQTIREDCCKSQ